MTGWRLGYCGGPKEIISGMNKIQSQYERDFQPRVFVFVFHLLANT